MARGLRVHKWPSVLKLGDHMPLSDGNCQKKQPEGNKGDKYTVYVHLNLQVLLTSLEPYIKDISIILIKHLSRFKFSRVECNRIQVLKLTFSKRFHVQNNIKDF